MANYIDERSGMVTKNMPQKTVDFLTARGLMRPGRYVLLPEEPKKQKETKKAEEPKE